MPILAKNAKPGKRYRTQKGVLVEVLRGKNGKVKKDDRNGEIKVCWVNPEGQADLSPEAEYGLEFGYRLNLVTYRGPGKPRHKSKEWWGWAHENPTLPEFVLKTCVDAGYYTREASNYIVAGYEGRNYLAVFRSGNLGLRLNPKDFFTNLGVRKHATRFMSYRFSLGAVGAGKVEADFKEELAALLENFKKAGK